MKQASEVIFLEFVARPGVLRIRSLESLLRSQLERVFLLQFQDWNSQEGCVHVGL